MRDVKRVLVWALQVFAGAVFVLVGSRKFVDLRWAHDFARWGYPAGFQLVIGRTIRVGTERDSRGSAGSPGLAEGASRTLRH